MEDWLEKAARYGDVASHDATSLIYVRAGLMSDVKGKIVGAIKAGLGTAAILAMIGMSGTDWESYIDDLRDRMFGKEQSVNEMLEESIPHQELTPSVMEIPKGNPQEDFFRGVQYNDIASLISGYEGNKGYVYDDFTARSIPWSKSKKGNPTIGIGHLMTGDQADRNLFTNLFGGKVDYDKLMNNTQSLDSAQVTSLFRHDARSRIREIIQRIPQFRSFNGATQAAIMNAKYRGDLGPRTIDRINEGNWNAAADEYLDHAEYKDTKYKIDHNLPTDKAGIVPRMEHNAEVFRSNAR